MTPLRIALLALAAASALFLLDRLLLAAESRGWIYYRRRKASPRALGGVFLATQGFLPEARYVQEAREETKKEVRREEQAAGDRPT